jgi:hypothetical protein
VSERSFRRSRQHRTERELHRRRRRAKVALAAGAGAGAAVLIAPAAQAATFTVTNLSDDDTDGTLRQTITNANAAAGDDTVVFQSGLSGTITLDPARGDIPITDDGLEVQGPGPDGITISGANQSRIFDLYGFNGQAEEVIVSGLTLSDGNADGDGGAIKDGPTSNPGLPAQLTIDNAVLTGNTASDGGAVAVNGSVDGTSLTITDSQITHNRASLSGGGLYAQKADLVVEGSTVSGNHAGFDGGGAYFAGKDGIGAGVTIESSTLSGNDANGRGGGGLTAFRWDAPLLIEDSTISGNSGRTVGGGAYLYTELDQPTTIRNSTIADNYAGNRGGGVYAYRYDNPGTGGQDDVTISSTIVADNTGPTGDLADQGGANVDGSFILGFSLIEDIGDAVYTESTVDSNIFAADPALNGLAPAGGPTETQVPSASSPALDAGVANSLTTDQRGLARTVDLGGVTNATGSDATDIGAVERAAAEPTQTAIDSGPADGAATNDSTPTFTFSSLDAGPTFQCSLGAGAPSFGSCSGIGTHTPAVALDDGIYTFQVAATSGTVTDPTPATRTFTVDTEPPETTIDSGPSDGSTISDPAPTFTFSSEPGSTFSCALDPAADTPNFGGCTSPGQYTASPELDDGTYTFRVIATDEAGNVEDAPATRTFTVDTSTPPPPPPPDDGDGGGGDGGAPPPAATVDCAGEVVTRQDGTAGNDTLVGGAGTDAIFGLDGDDALTGAAGNDCLDGGGGADSLDGGGGKDELSGSAGKDRVVGGPGKDAIDGGGGKDKINAVDGKKDKLNCGGGKDKAKVDAKDKVSSNCDVVAVNG